MTWYSPRTWFDQPNLNVPVRAVDMNRVERAIDKLAGWVPGASQPLDQDLSNISALTPTNNDFLQRKSGAWANRTPAQVKTDLSLPSDTVTELAGKVGTTGNEIIAGIKSFSSVITALGDIFVNAAAGVTRDITYQSGGNSRWILRVTNTAESGSDVGSDFQLLSRTDAGASKAAVIAAKRSTGQVTIDVYPMKGHSAVTGSRPAASAAGNGATMFDSTLNKPIWSNGTNWVDATGTTV